MADIVLTRKHNFPIDLARTKLAKLVESFDRNNPGFVSSVAWEADKGAAAASGKMFESKFKVTDTTLTVEVELKGFAAKMFKSTAQSRLEKTVGEEFPA